MKKLLTFLFCVLFAFMAMATPWDGTAAAAFAGGAGTVGNPYQIATAEQLAYLASLANAPQTANANTTGIYYKLTADIDLNGPSKSWIPIGIATATAFAGVFDGNYHTISNIYINDAATVYAGLFGYPTGTSGSNVIIKNLTIASGSITVTNSGSTAGAFAGRALYTQFVNCKNIINVSGVSGVGGIVGTFGNSTTTGIIEYCSNTGIISGSGASLYVGGIAGNSTVNTNVSPVSYIRYCYNTGAVKAVSNAGGIAGTNSGTLTIQECFNKGTITSSTSTSGGIIGYGYALLNVLNCYNAGTVRGTHATTITINGGILGNPGGSGAGKFFTAITNCYNTGSVTATAAGSTVEAIAGSLAGTGATGSGTVGNSYFLNSLAVTSVNGGSGVDATTLQGYASTLDASKWSSDVSPNKNNGYPILTWQTTTSSTLTVPTVGTASSPTTSGFTANWTAGVSNALGYTVTVYQNGTTFVQSSSVTGQANATLAITGLTANTSYTYKVAAISNTGTVDSNESSASATVKTLGVPTITTQATTSISTTTATANGNITSLGNPNPTQYGHCWNTSTNPTTSNSKTSKGAASATGAYTSSMTSLISSTTYYVRAYATNTSGTAYGSEVSFSTATAATDYFRSKATGNWSDASSWESSYDNINWVSASAAPSSSASSVSILNGHTITVAANTTTSNLILNSGAIVTVNGSIQLTVSSSMTNNGTLNILSTNADGTATLLTPTTISGSGTTNVNQYLTYHTWYMSSPVSSATPANMSVIKYFNETVPANVWPDATTMTAGTGYLVTPNISTYANNILFSGTLNTGSQPITLTSTIANTDFPGFNLIGNPYPSYLDWTAVCGYTPDGGTTHPNQAIMPTTTMWYRTKASGSWGFVTVNGAGVSSPAGVVTNYIPPMQAFWVRANANAVQLQLTNSMCSHTASSNALKAPAAKNTEQLQLVRLQLNNGTQTDEAVIYFSASAKNGFDIYDAPKMINSDISIPGIYSLLNNEQIVINAMNSIPLNQEISLGFVPGSASSFSIKANEVSNLPAGVKLILKDNVTQAETDLTDAVSTYNFSSATSSNSRFSVIFRSSGSVTGTFGNTDDKNISIYKNINNQITVSYTSNISDNAFISVFNALGQKLESKQISTTTTVIDRGFNPGVYVVTVTNGGKSIIKKVILN